ncbi:hypothetical protein HN385_02445 [archaeon]|jgi:organic radical activating enzyme|nr:hypothetical protein [archaeon]MBT3450777.1 hypothetical protein [archaeon]MBT6868810.1 hypothetical protein [archaeon]MBT7192969.1 hypothetical protein [archaeon]MBT7380935.1 hypothetical protein [archaeon]
MKTDPIDRALMLRESLIQNDKILVADFRGTLQGEDTSKVIDLMPIVGTTDYPFRTKVNVKEIDPLASEKYETPFFDITKKTENEIEKFLRKQEFDFPLWYKHERQFNMKKVNFYNAPFTLQIAGCNFHTGNSSGGCWYCFVDDKNNNGLPGQGKVNLGINETIDSMLSARKKIVSQYQRLGHDTNLKVLRTSGGEPTIVLDWILNLWREIKKRNLDFVGQLDSNLSTATLVDYFESERIFEKFTLEKLAEYPIKVLTALKGVDDCNLQQNVQSVTSIEDQMYSLKRFVNSGFDIFPQMYNPDPKKLRNYLENVDNIIDNISLRIHIGPLKLYGPNSKRLTFEAQRKGVDEVKFIVDRQISWNSNYIQSCEIINNYLKEKYGVSYKEVTRSDVKLKVK